MDDDKADKSYAANSMILKNNRGVKNSVATLHKDKAAQDDVLITRLAERRKKAAAPKKGMTRKFSLQQLQPLVVEEEDCSAGPRSPNRKQSIETDLVEIMERWYAVKAAKIADIKVSYTTQIKELEETYARTKADTYTMIIEATKQSMEDDVAKACEDIDNKRKEEIRNLRESYKNTLP